VKVRLSIKLALIAIGLLTGLAVTLDVRSSLERTGINALTLQAYAGNTNAADSLKSSGSNAAPELIELKQDTNESWERKLWLGRTKSPDVPPQLPGLPARPPSAAEIREAGARALGEMRDEGEAAVLTLIGLLQDMEGNVRWEAAKSLAKFGKMSVPLLIDFLEDKTNSARGMVIYTLGLIGPEAGAAVPTLMPKLTDPNEQVRSQAEHTMSCLGPEAVLAMVRLSTHGEPPAREAAHRVLHRLAASSESPIMTLRKLAGDGAVTNRVRAMEALGDLRPATSLSIKTLITALDDNTPEVRLAAVNSLGNIGAKAAIARADLTRLASDPDDAIRNAAKSAIEKIGRSAVPPP